MTEVQKKSEKKKRRNCFVVCPIGSEGSDTRRHSDWLYHEIIEHVLEHQFSGQFNLTRADKISTPGMIDAQMIGHLLDDDLVIADMSELNPNAFYEMGIRHMIEKPIIHMFKTGEKIPFDVSLYRAIEFDYDYPEQLVSARNNLTKFIRTLQEENYKSDNPVIRARGIVQLKQSATPEDILVADQLADLYARIKQIEMKNKRPINALSLDIPTFHQKNPLDSNVEWALIAPFKEGTNNMDRRDISIKLVELLKGEDNLNILVDPQIQPDKMVVRGIEKNKLKYVRDFLNKYEFPYLLSEFEIGPV